MFNCLTKSFIESWRQTTVLHISLFKGTAILRYWSGCKVLWWDVVTKDVAISEPWLHSNACSAVTFVCLYVSTPSCTQTVDLIFALPSWCWSEYRTKHVAIFEFGPSCIFGSQASPPQSWIPSMGPESVFFAGGESLVHGLSRLNSPWCHGGLCPGAYQSQWQCGQRLAVPLTQMNFVVLGVLRQRYQHCLVLHGLAMIQNLYTWFLLSVRCLHWVLASLDWGPTGILGCWPGMIQRTRCPCMSWHGWCWDMLGTYFPAVWFLAIKTISLVRELSFLCKLRLLQQS